MTTDANRTFNIAYRCSRAQPKAVGWSSDGKHPMSHDAPLTESQWRFLRACGVIRSDQEIAVIEGVR